MSKKKRNKFSIAKKEKIVDSILNGEESYESAARIYKTCHRLISLWVNCYKRHGKMGLSFKKGLAYNGDFKLSLIQEMKSNGLSLHQMSVQYLISPSTLSTWRRQYEQHGALALLESKSRGRPPKMKRSNRKENNKSMNLDDILQENERLRIENEYLKKLQALIQQEKARVKNNERKSSKS